ncbi:hypothetical protein FS837_011723 [Tulasnella sp. UAMH 9824]|nr:hypothetical protein FS837_011723 [Tulasnella sp. UAMH 9824]
MSLSLLSAPSPTEASKHGVVGIFWDYESCPNPHTSTIIEAIEAIQNVAVASGSINCFNVYADLDRHPKKAGATASLRQQLHNAGVSVVDCPSNADKTVADKMIIVDLFAFAMRSRLPGTVVVISADPDLAYTLSLLRQRRTKVTFISSDAAIIGTAITSQADARFVWNGAPTGQILWSLGNSHLPRTVDPVPSPRPNHNSLPPATEPVAQASTHQSSASGSGTIAQAPIPSNPSIPITDHRTANPTATVASNAGGSQNFTRASVPAHLHDIVTELLQAVKPRGWPEEEIYGRLHRLNKTKWNDPAVFATYLAEAVQLGIFVQSTGLSVKNRREHQYYAIKETLKNNWRQS